MGEMPEEICLYKCVSTHEIVWTPSPHRGTQYRLKSSEDKTIRELAAALEEAEKTMCQYFPDLGPDNGCRPFEQETGHVVMEIRRVLIDNAPQIAEAQEEKR